ncbi:hypothetical protein SERLA73DRAFT_176023 [Serpula lacrymans var. lacrymans S7.3]|uniref:Uncharacterized protein n=2 Tax=Serpula lacrymans var. lacrymans TaxID=341189 RepID=F8PM30_SERL3|nr:uncharacterized protein SERLADRAFT_458747 [Serpula lacrymans var. lacrymans S7.9]EGO02662.1 hypothetical protein SERLA73DRAFT_176023 [Serpula lacrymans var. lacrymans S7.3]EGO28368.1 hypothetical protein SERLADRAFT_458747 [Serpula lacrymans var. lacrymans S7.9]
MATSQHYLWAGGHLVLLVSALRYIAAWVTLKSISPWWYKMGLLGGLLSYAIVCQKSLGVRIQYYKVIQIHRHVKQNPNLSVQFIKRALLDENFQYLIVAFFWWSSSPVAIALLPYMIFSLFHVLTFFRTTVMPRLLGSTSAVGGPQSHPLSKSLQVWVKSNYDPAMKLVAFIELFIFVRVAFGALTFHNSLLAPLVYGHFLRQRYYQSIFTRNALSITDEWVDTLVMRAGNPPTLVRALETVRGAFFVE